MSHDSGTENITLPETLSCSSLAIGDHHPRHPSSFSFISSPLGFLPSSIYLNIFPITSGLSLSDPGTLLSLHLCPGLRRWHMVCMNSAAAGQPQIRYEHTAHGAQLFKRLSQIAHASYSTSWAAEEQIIKPFICLAATTWEIIDIKAVQPRNVSLHDDPSACRCKACVVFFYASLWDLIWLDINKGYAVSSFGMTVKSLLVLILPQNLIFCYLLLLGHRLLVLKSKTILAPSSLM